MSTQQFPLGPDAAHRAVAAMNQGYRTMRRIPVLPESMLRMSNNNRLYIHNVGPWDHVRLMGSMGQFVIPKKPKDAPYASMRAIPGIVTELIPVDETQFALESSDPMDLAQQILGEGRFQMPGHSLRLRGVFISRNEVPTDEELDAAHETLYNLAKEMFDEAEMAYAKGPKDAELIIGPDHRTFAAVMLGRLDAPWVSNHMKGERQLCPVCGNYSDEGVMLCGNHNPPHIFDMAAYKAWKTAQKAAMAE